MMLMRCLPKPLQCACFIALFATVCFQISSLSGATLYWDISDTAPLQGGNGNWNHSDTNWNPAIDGSATRTTWTNGDDANFTSGTSNITITENIIASSISQTGSANTTISGTSLLSLTGNTGISNTSSSSLIINSDLEINTFNTVFTGTGTIIVNGSLSESAAGAGIHKTGSNTLQLNNANSFTGEVVVNSGTISVGNNQALGSTLGKTIANGGTIALQNGVTVTGETITISGSGYTGSNNFAGALQAAANSTATWAGTVELNGSARIGANGPSATLIIDGKITGNGNLEIGSSTGIDGGGTTLITGNHGNDFTGNVNLVRGTLKFGANNVLPSSVNLTLNSASTTDIARVDLNGTVQTVSRLIAGTSDFARDDISLITNTSSTKATLITNQTAETNFFGAINGNIDFVKRGGVINFAGPNTSTLDGSLDVEGVFTIGLHQPVTLAGVTVLNVNSAIFKKVVTSDTTLNTLYIRGNNFTSESHSLIIREGGLTLDGYIINLNAGDTAGAVLMLLGDVTTLANSSTSSLNDNQTYTNVARGYVDLGGGIRTFNVADGSASADLEITAKVTNGGIRKTGAGLMRLSGNSDYDGTTTIESGIVTVQHNNALGSSVGGTIVMDGARLILNNNITVTNETLSLAGNGGDFFGGIQAAANARATWAGDIILNSNARIGSANALSELTITGSIQNGAISNLIIAGHGTHILSGVSTYTGTTSIIRGILKIDEGDDRLPTGTVLDIDSSTAVEAAIFDLNGHNQTVAALVSSGATANGSTSYLRNTNTSTEGTLTINVTSGTRTFNGIIEGGIGLGDVNITKTGSGTQTFKSINTYTGKTTVRNGILSITSTGSINESRWLQIDSPGSLNFATTQTFSQQTITGSGTINGNLIANGSTIFKPGGSSNEALSALSTAGNLTGSLTINGSLSLHSTLDPNIPRAVFQLGGTNSHTLDASILSSITAFSTASSGGLYDSIDVNGLLGLEAGSKLKIELLPGYTPGYGDVFNLLDWDSINFNTNGAGNFTISDLILPTLDNGNIFMTDLFLSHGILYVVPEPGKTILSLLALAFCVSQRRRR